LPDCRDRFIRKDQQLADDLTSEQADALFNFACNVATGLFAESGEVMDAALFSPAGQPDSVAALSLTVPPVGLQRRDMWNLVRIMAIAQDAVAIVNLHEFWHSPSGSTPAFEAPDREEGVLVLMHWRSGNQVLQRSASWSILRNMDGDGTLGEKTITPDMPAPSETETATLLPVRRPTRLVQRRAAKSLEELGVLPTVRHAA
jgi:hypothetical protein